jgi:translation initiation factor 5B
MHNKPNKSIFLIFSQKLKRFKRKFSLFDFMKIRQPIVTVAGHVDHGKTTILDSIRGTCIASKEPGMITQKISFTQVPSEHIKKKCNKLLGKFKIKLEIPGFLFIDTPGHAAFTNLRKRGGSLADLAILVVDINEGIM